MNNRGQTVIVSSFIILILIVGVFISWPVIQPLILGAQTDDNLTNFFLDIAGVAVLFAALFAWFIFRGVEVGR